MGRQFFTLDVFTKDPLAGNPLAVVIDADGLDATRMQAIAREFNLSETVFVLPARNPVNTARVRIFTPAPKLPFAGHPTIGTAVLLAHCVRQSWPAAPICRSCSKRRSATSPARCGSREEARPTPISTCRDCRSGSATPIRPRSPRRLSLAPEDIGFDGHACAVYSAGTPFCFVPIASLAAISRARPRRGPAG